MRCRKNVRDLSLDEKSRFVRAIKGLKARDSVLRPGAQSRYDDYVEIHMAAMDAAVITPPNIIVNPGWAHFDSAFFPWHRELLYRFEEDLRSVEPDVTIPYWDWTRGQSSASSAWPFTHDFIGVDGNDANLDRVERQAGAPSPYPYEFDPLTWTVVVKDTAAEPSFLRRGFGERADAPSLPQNDTVVTGTNSSFRQAIGSSAYLLLRARSEGLHNLVHRWANGSMITASSPNDPVFWMHHANIDRMWTLWQGKNPALPPYVHTNGFTGHGLTDTLIFHDPGNPAPWVGTATPNQLLDGHAMHATSIWYHSDLPELTLESGSTLSFGDVPEGMTHYRAVHFRIQTCRQVRFRIIGAPTGNFGLTPQGAQFIAEPDLAADGVDGYVWAQFYANGASPQFSSMTVEAFIVDDEGYYAATEGGEFLLGTFPITLSASIVPRDNNAVVLVLDRSGSMAAAAGRTSTRATLLKGAVSVFHALLRPSDEVGLVVFDDVVDNLLPLTTQAAGLGTSLTGPGLDPRGFTGLGAGMQAGAAMLVGASHTNRSLVVLTAGNQNVRPYLEDLPPGTLTSRTHAIGFGPPGEVSDAPLNSITQNSGGDLIVTGLLSSQQERYLLTNYFVQVLAGVTNASVVLDLQEELLLGSEHSTPFLVTEADVSIDVMVLSPLALFIDVLVRTPSGTEIDPVLAGAEPNISFELRPEVVLYRMDLPALPLDVAASHAGTWHIVTRARKEDELKNLLRDNEFSMDIGTFRRTVGRGGSLPYTCVVHAQSNLDFNASLVQSSFEPGTRVVISATLREYGPPFTGDASVWAEVTAPDATVSSVRLTPEGARYAGAFTTATAGVYRVGLRAEGSTSYGSRFVREKSLTAGAYVAIESPGTGGVIEELRQRDRALGRLLDYLVDVAGRSEAVQRAGLDLEGLRSCLADVGERLDRGRVGPRSMEPDPAVIPPFDDEGLLARHVEPVIEWADEATRRETAAAKQANREAMQAHEDPGALMFPPLNDDGQPDIATGQSGTSHHETGPDRPRRTLSMEQRVHPDDTDAPHLGDEPDRGLMMFPPLKDDGTPELRIDPRPDQSDERDG